MDNEALSAFAADVMSYPVGESAFVCADFLDGGDPNPDQAGARTELTPELVLQHTRTNFAEGSEEEPDKDLWAAGYREGDRWTLRVREMAARPDRPTTLIAEIVEELSGQFGAHLQYASAPN